jgi:hypothetical protein
MRVCVCVIISSDSILCSFAFIMTTKFGSSDYVQILRVLYCIQPLRVDLQREFERGRCQYKNYSLLNKHHPIHIYFETYNILKWKELRLIGTLIATPVCVAVDGVAVVMT